MNYDNHISSISNPHEVSASQVGAYTKEEVDTLISNVDVDLSNYYTKSESELALSNKVDIAELLNYYNKSEVDTLISNVDVDLSNYYNKSETYNKTQVDTLISNVDVDLSNYYTILETTNLLSTKVDKVDGKGLSTNDLTNDLKSEIESVKVVEVTPDIENHKLVVTYSNDLIVNIDFNDLVTDIYVEGATLDTNTNILTLKSSGGGADVLVDLSHFVNKTEIANYYNKAEVNTLISNVDVDLSNYYNKSESDSKFVSRNTSSLNRLAKFSDTNGSIVDSNLISSPAGDLGLNVFPSLWDSSVRALETAAGSVFNLNNNSIKMIQNGYYSVGGFYIYKKSGPASLYSQENGEHIWSTAPSGLVETSLTFTEKMKLDSTGNLFVNGAQVITTNNINLNIEDSLTSESITKALSAKQGKILNDTKVDKVDGKGLSTNDLTNDLKSEIESVKVADITIDGPNKDIIVQYTNNTTNSLSLDDIVSQSEIDKKIQIESIMLNDSISSYLEIYGTNTTFEETVYQNQHDVFNDNSCYATYLFDGNADDLGGLYNGVASNVTYVPGSHNEAASFNGTNSKIDIANIILPDTIVATFYLKVNAFKDQMFLDFGDGRCIFMYTTADRRLRAQYANVNNAHTSSTNVLELGVTYFVVATITKTSATLNIDKVDQTKTAWNNYINSRGKSIGYRNDNALYSNCTIDQLKLFNRVLTPTEIEFLYIGTFGSYQVSKIQLSDAVFMYPKGMLGSVYYKEYQQYSGITGIGTLTDGWKYVAKDENNVFKFYTEKPTIGKTGSGMYFLNGQLYDGNDVLISPAISFLKDKIRIENGLIVETADAEIPRTVSINSANTDLSGLSTLSSPKLNVEVLTEFRHPVNNKPIYTKVLDFGTLPNNTTKTLAHSLTNIDFIEVDYNQSYVYPPSSTIKYPVVWTSTTLANQWNCWVDGTNISMQTGADRTTFKAYIVLRYTKTSDTENTPTRLVGNLDYIVSPNGTKYKIVVDNAGVLSTVLA